MPFWKLVLIVALVVAGPTIAAHLIVGPPAPDPICREGFVLARINGDKLCIAGYRP